MSFPLLLLRSVYRGSVMKEELIVWSLCVLVMVVGDGSLVGVHVLTVVVE